MDTPDSARPTNSASTEGDGQAHIKRGGAFARLRAYFLAGILVTTPIAVTGLVAVWLIEFVDARIVPLIPQRFNPDFYVRDYLNVPVGVPGLGLLILVVGLTLIGWMAAGFVGRFFLRTGESILDKMPVVRTIYGATKQILETVLAQQSQAFRQPVLIEYPRKGIWAVAFLTAEAAGEVGRRLGQVEGQVEGQERGQKVVNVFLPTTPNPTSGFLLMVPESEVIFLEMSVEDAIKLVISAGIVTPEVVAARRREEEAGRASRASRRRGQPALPDASEPPAS